uniref:Uncharacterized protein n=1 Tax=Opuntia streptacantha TaxID=393608 RepID=A0A7C9DSW8_OPUST
MTKTNASLKGQAGCRLDRQDTLKDTNMWNLFLRLSLSPSLTTQISPYPSQKLYSFELLIKVLHPPVNLCQFYCNFLHTDSYSILLLGVNYAMDGPDIDPTHA